MDRLLSRSRRSIFAAAVAALAVSLMPPSTHGNALVREDVEALFDGFIPYALQRSDVAGAIVVVVKNGEVLLQKGYGYADLQARRQIDPESTLFRPGSVSKLFTWTAVMQLVEQNRIDLDRDIVSYLDFKIPPLDGQPITMRDLMTHTAGFQDSLKDLVTAQATAPALGSFLKKQVPDRIFPPGKITSYSNYGAALAGYIVERVSGQSFDDYVEQHVFAPLGMRHTTFRQPLPPTLAPMMSRGYIAASEGPQPFEMFGPSPAGGSATTGADIGKFMIAHLHDGEYLGHRILRQSTAQLMHNTPLTTISPALNRMTLGFIQSDRNGHRIIGHDGDTRLFHSSLLLFLDEDVGLFISLNSAGRAADTFDIRRALFDAFTDRYFPVTTRNEEIQTQIDKTHAALMIGEYEGSRREQTSFVSFINLLTQVTLSTDDHARILTPFRKLDGEAKKFEEISPFVWREVAGQELLAAKLENGKVVVWGQGDDATGGYTRVPGWRRASWLLPLLLCSIAVLFVTAAAWPISAIARRHYGIRPRDVGVARTYRWVHIAAVAQCAVVVVWLTIIFGMLATFYITWMPYFISKSMDKWILIAHLLSVAILPIATLVALGNTWVTFCTRRGWRNLFSGLWSVALVTSSLTLLYVAVVFHFIGFGAAF